MADEKKAPAPEEKKPKADVATDEKKGSPDAKKEKKKEAKQAAEKKVKKVDYGPDFKYIVRIANTDLEGTQQTWLALTGVKGIGVRMGSLIADQAGVPRRERIGKLTDQQIESLAKTVEAVAGFSPGWIVNRQFDVETGQDLHQVGTNVDIALRDDLNRLKKIASYRGIRHENGQKVRGQRSRSNGRTGLTVGVSRVKAPEEKKEEAAPAAGKPAAPAAGAKPAAAPAAGGKPAAPAPGGAKPAAPAGGAKPAAKPEGGKK